ncbi:ion transporter [Leptospira adleri]|uniref:Ion transporter n=1 Tax=Leptospira adleri TaxID=2023186 RepID=A0A2M9YTX5_9LEPT|nr:ion transporter [Leptospira adleri]PJZ54985.1 ion transporter [Leptospira adleri]PJZ60927.1 ion transporter [Leptospira adleri]TGM59887.1 ion transporter [Leptospira adleri]
MEIDKFVVRNILKTLVEYAVIILFGLGIVYLDEIEFSGIEIKYLIVLLAGTKSIYFFIKGFRKISELSVMDLKYYEFLVFIAVNISVIIVSFGLDFFCLYRVDPASFSGLPSGAAVFGLLFKFFYFSLMIFTNIGIIKIIPESTEAEVAVIFEAILSFITIIFVLSDFLSLKESLGRRRSDSKNSD